MHPFDGGFHYKTVVIPVRIRHGRVVTLDGQRLPDSLEDVPGRLIVPAFYFREEKQFAYLQAEGEGVFVPAGSVILMGITTPSPDREKRDPHVMPLSRRARDYLDMSGKNTPRFKGQENSACGFITSRLFRWRTSSCISGEQNGPASESVSAEFRFSKKNCLP